MSDVLPLWETLPSIIEGSLNLQNIILVAQDKPIGLVNRRGQAEVPAGVEVLPADTLILPLIESCSLDTLINVTVPQGMGGVVSISAFTVVP